MRSPALLVAVVAASCLGCGDDGSRELPVDAGGESDRRYRLELSVAPAEAIGEGDLRVRVRPRSGWHLAPEAPVRLNLAASGDMRFEPSFQEAADAASFDRDGLEFRSTVLRDGPNVREATGQLRFGICEGEDGLCAIVRRELRFRLPTP